MPDIACVNGVFSPLADARVPIEDRGYQFADGVYEVIVAPAGKPFLLDGHLARLAASLDGIALAIDLPALKLPDLIAEGIRRCAHRDVMVYVQITRGMAPRDHIFPNAASPTVVLTFKPKPVYDPALTERGVTLISTRDIRWARCHIKSIALLANVLIKNDARAKGCFDALIVSDDQTVRETTAANIFIATGGKLLTPPRSAHILPGITRGYLLEQAAKLNLPVEERDFKLADALRADEAFITSTTMNVMPVTTIDQRTIGDGKPGKLTRQLASCF